MNKKINTISIFVAIAVITIGVVSFQNYSQSNHNSDTTESDQKYTSGFVPPGEIIKQKVHTKEIVDLSEIKSLKGYDVKIGTNLPEGYKVQYIAGSISPDNYVNILIGKRPITDDTTDMEFVYGKGEGVAVTVAPYDPKTHTPETIQAQFAMFNPTKVKISNIEGYGHDIFTQEIVEGEPNSSPAELAFVKDDKYIFLIGMVPLERLVQIAENL